MEKKHLKSRSALVNNAVKEILSQGFEKYGEEDFALQEAVSGVPAWINLYSHVGLKYMKFARGCGTFFELRGTITDEKTRQHLLKMAHDTLDMVAWGELFLAEITRMLDVDPMQLTLHSYSEKSSPPLVPEKPVATMPEASNHEEPQPSLSFRETPEDLALVRGKLGEFSKDGSLVEEKMLYESVKSEISVLKFKSAIDFLINEGVWYRPKPGYLKKVPQ